MENGGAAGGFLCCLVTVVGIVALFVWLPRRAQSAVGNAIDRHVPGQSGGFSVLDGFTTGLNARSSQATRAQLRVGSGYVAVGRMSVMGSKVTVEVFEPEDILSVHEGDIERAGVDGVLANANANTNLGRALGWTADAPGLLLRTRRGDVAFTVRPKQRGELRQAFLAIGALVSDSEPQ
jgi:hypothetical protein